MNGDKEPKENPNPDRRAPFPLRRAPAVVPPLAGEPLVLGSSSLKRKKRNSSDTDKKTLERVYTVHALPTIQSPDESNECADTTGTTDEVENKESKEKHLKKKSRRRNSTVRSPWGSALPVFHFSDASVPLPACAVAAREAAKEQELKKGGSGSLYPKPFSVHSATRQEVSCANFAKGRTGQSLSLRQVNPTEITKPVGSVRFSSGTTTISSAPFLLRTTVREFILMGSELLKRMAVAAAASAGKGEKGGKEKSDEENSNDLLATLHSRQGTFEMDPERSLLSYVFDDSDATVSVSMRKKEKRAWFASLRSNSDKSTLVMRKAMQRSAPHSPFLGYVPPNPREDVPMLTSVHISAMNTLEEAARLERPESAEKVLALLGVDEGKLAYADKKSTKAAYGVLNKYFTEMIQRCGSLLPPKFPLATFMKENKLNEISALLDGLNPIRKCVLQHLLFFLRRFSMNCERRSSVSAEATPGYAIVALFQPFVLLTTSEKDRAQIVLSLNSDMDVLPEMATFGPSFQDLSAMSGERVLYRFDGLLCEHHDAAITQEGIPAQMPIIYLSNYRMIVCQQYRPTDSPDALHDEWQTTTIPIGSISNITAYENEERVWLQLVLTDMNVVDVIQYCQEPNTLEGFHSALRRVMRLSLLQPFALLNKEVEIIPEDWARFDFEKEFSRLGFDPEVWTVSPCNDMYNLCSSYPSRLIIPKSLHTLLTSPQKSVKGAPPPLKPASVFLFNRFPVATWRCPTTGNYLVRSYDVRTPYVEHAPQQPMSARSSKQKSEDKKNPASASEASGDTEQNEEQEVLQRRRSNMLNQVMGTYGDAGRFILIECMESPNSHSSHMNLRLPTPAQVQEALLLTAREELLPKLLSKGTADVYTHVLPWTSLIGHVLAGANAVSSYISSGEGTHKGVVLQVGDAECWANGDAEVSSLVQVMLDPHARTINGFVELVEKEWLAFGFPFSMSSLLDSEQTLQFTTVSAQPVPGAITVSTTSGLFTADKVTEMAKTALEKNTPAPLTPSENEHPLERESSQKVIVPVEMPQSKATYACGTAGAADNQTLLTKFGRVTPMFIHFIHCVYTLLHFYPQAFEFNSSFLEWVAVSSFSRRFGTFLCNSELERQTVKIHTPSAWTYLKKHLALFRNNVYTKTDGRLLFDKNKMYPVFWAQYFYSEHPQYKRALQKTMKTVASYKPREGSLNLSNLCLPFLPNISANVPMLKHLYLNGNCFTALDNTIGDFMWLRKLIFRGNLLSANAMPLRPYQLFAERLHSLQTLDISESPLHTVTDDIACFSHLKNLFLDNTAITALPKTLVQLTNLSTLSCCFNKFETLDNVELPESITNLSLSDSGIKSIPASWGHSMKKLMLLDLSRNLLSSMPDSFRSITTLRSLKLRCNKFTCFPSFVTDSHSMVALDLSRNPIDTIPNEVYHLTMLQTLDLSETKIAHLPITIGQLKKLRVLNLSQTGCSLPTLCPTLGLLREEALKVFILSTDKEAQPTAAMQGSDIMDPLGDDDLPPLTRELSGPEKALAQQRLLSSSQHNLRASASQAEDTMNMLSQLAQQLHEPAQQVTARVLVLGPDGVGKTTVVECLNTKKKKRGSVSLSPGTPSLLFGEASIEAAEASDSDAADSNSALGDSVKSPRYSFSFAELQSSAALAAPKTPATNTGKQPMPVLTTKGTALSYPSSATSTGNNNSSSGGTVSSDVPTNKTADLVRIDRHTWPLGTDDKKGATKNVVVNLIDFGRQCHCNEIYPFLLRDETICLLVYDVEKYVQIQQQQQVTEFEAKMERWIAGINTYAPASPLILVGTHRDKVSTNQWKKAAADVLASLRKYHNHGMMLSVAVSGEHGGFDLKESILRACQTNCNKRSQTRQVLFEQLVIEEFTQKKLPFTSKERLKELASFCGIRKGIESQTALELVAQSGIVTTFDDDPELAGLAFTYPQWFCDIYRCVLYSGKNYGGNGVLEHREILERMWVTITPPQSLAYLKIKHDDGSSQSESSSVPTQRLHERLFKIIQRLLERFGLAYSVRMDRIVANSMMLSDLASSADFSEDCTSPDISPTSDNLIPVADSGSQQQSKSGMYILIPELMLKARPDSIIQKKWPSVTESILNSGRVYSFKHCYPPSSLLFWRLVSRALKIVLLDPVLSLSIWRHGFLVVQEYAVVLMEENVKTGSISLNLRGTKSVDLARSLFGGMQAELDEKTPYLCVSVPCSHCLKLNISDPTYFQINLVENAISEGSQLICHGVTMIDADAVSPDLCLSALNVPLLNYSDIVRGKQLGQGGTATVYAGELAETTVAVKELTKNIKQEVTGSSTLTEFRREAATMSRCLHPTLVQIIGLCVEPICLIAECVPYGDLQKFILDTEHQPLDFPFALKIAHDIASGMRLLHSLSPPRIHRDLKSPNVLMASLNPHDYVCAKVTDFGLTDIPFSVDLGAVENPIWLAPEIMHKEEATTASDVYSFGVIMWELISRKQLFGEISFMHVIEEKIMAGERPPIPEGCDAQYRKLLERCWSGDPKQRPTFAVICEVLEALMKIYAPDYPLCTDPKSFEAVRALADRFRLVRLKNATNGALRKKGNGANSSKMISSAFSPFGHVPSTVPPRSCEDVMIHGINSSSRNVKVHIPSASKDCDATTEFEICVSLKRQIFRGAPLKAGAGAKGEIVLQTLVHSSLWTVRADGICAHWNSSANALVSTLRVIPSAIEEKKPQPSPSMSMTVSGRHRRKDSFSLSREWSVSQICVTNKHPWFTLSSNGDRILVSASEDSVVEEFDSAIKPLMTAFIGEYVVTAVSDPQPGLVFWDDEALHPQKREISLKREELGFDIADIKVLSGANNLAVACSGKCFALVDLASGRRSDSKAKELNSPILSACITKDGAIWLALEDGNIAIIDSHTGRKKCVVDILRGVRINKLESIVERNVVAAVLDDGIILFAKNSHIPFAFLKHPFDSDNSDSFVSVSSECFLNENPSGVSSSTIYAVTRSSLLCAWSLFFTVPL